MNLDRRCRIGGGSKADRRCQTLSTDTFNGAALGLLLSVYVKQLENFAGTACGTGPTASLRDALARSCNTAFAELGAQLGEDHAGASGR